MQPGVKIARLLALTHMLKAFGMLNVLLEAVFREKRISSVYGWHQRVTNLDSIITIMETVKRANSFSLRFYRCFAALSMKSIDPFLRPARDVGMAICSVFPWFQPCKS